MTVFVVLNLSKVINVNGELAIITDHYCLNEALASQADDSPCYARVVLNTVTLTKVNIHRFSLSGIVYGLEVVVFVHDRAGRSERNLIPQRLYGGVENNSK
jgi:hypothetical protein